MIKRFLSFLFLVCFAIFASLVISPYLRMFLYQSGILQAEISIAGTGSMYPTFPKAEGENDIVRANQTVAWPKMRIYPSGINILGLSLFSHRIAYGDIVEFENETTKSISIEKYGDEAGFVKRVIAASDDVLEFRDGYVFLNGTRLDEPYTAKPRSTYGGDSLVDCQKLTVPDNYIFVMGDNRKASLDSRFELGLVNLSDVHFVLPWDDQEEYRSTWRDTSEDEKYAHSPTLDDSIFVDLLNEKRREKNLKPLKNNLLLANSGKIRGKRMIDTNDFSTEATRSGITMEKSIKSAGYSNIIFAEVFTRGFYEAQELLDNFLEFPGTKKLLFSDKYQDIGIGTVLGDVDSCPVQVIVVHLGGYVPPNYSKTDIESWEKLIANLEKALEFFNTLSESENIDREKVEKVISLINLRNDRAKKVSDKLHKNLWLSEEEKKYVSEDKNLDSEINKFIEELRK